MSTPMLCFVHAQLQERITRGCHQLLLFSAQQTNSIAEIDPTNKDMQIGLFVAQTNFAYIILLSPKIGLSRLSPSRSHNISMSIVSFDILLELPPCLFSCAFGYPTMLPRDELNLKR
jgi:hypothetical protein